LGQKIGKFASYRQPRTQKPLYLMIETVSKERYLSPQCKQVDLQLEGLIALSRDGVENPDIDNTDIG